MPSKPAAKPSPGTDMLDPLAQLVESDASAVETPPAEAPAPPLFEPATDDPDDEDDDEGQEEARAVAPKTSRRGFLGAAAAMVGASAVAAAAPTAAEPAAAPTGMTLDMAAMASFFHQLMDERDRKQQEDLDRRFAALRAELSPGAPSPNGVVPQESPAELAALPGQYPPSMIFQQPVITQAGLGPEEPLVDLPAPVSQAPRAPRMVAFIPKEDPYNPRQTTFKGWVNGRELRAKRGQVMIVSLGTAVDWAKNGHGNVVDIAAMQGAGVVEPMRIPQPPNYARPQNWDGLPLDNRSSIPIGRAV